MANPNPEIWGTPETWQNNFILGGSTTAGAENLKASKAKVAKWDVEGWTVGTSQLRAAVMNNKITPNQPIDKTICPCGQDITVSHLNQIGVFVNRNEDEYSDDTDVQYITLINALGHSGAPVNWSFFECRRPGSGASAYFQDAYELDMASTRYPYTVWYPSADFDSSTSAKQNGNYYVAPFVTYQSRSILLRVEVGYITTRYADDSPNGVTWITLDDWKNTHSDKKIASIRLRIYKVNTLSLSEIKYNTTSVGNYDFIGAMLLDTINVGTTNYDLQESFEHFGFMGMGQTGWIYLLPILSNLSNQRKSNEYIYGFMPCMNLFEGAELKTVRHSSSNRNLGKVWQEVPYSDDTYEKIMSMAALFGCPFTPTNTTTFSMAFTNDGLCLPIIDDNGITHGEYTRGSENTNNPFISLDNIRDKDYKPDADVDPNTYSDTTNWNNVDFRQSFTKRYLLTGSQVVTLASELWAAQSSKPADIDYNNFAIDEYLTNNPIDTIVSLKYFPCTFADVAPAIVHLGKYTTNIAATALGTSVRIIDFAPIECFPHFNDFRDYEPYTEIAMYIPFCGTVKIPTAECMGNYVSVKLAIDTNTGAATGYVIVSKTGSGGICVATCQGMAAIDIPVSGLQSANLANAVFNATANWTQTQVNNISANSGLFRHMGGTLGAIARGMSNSVNLSDVKGSVLGGPIGAAGTLVNSLNPISALQKGLNIDIDNAKADYELSHIQVPTRLVGSASPVLGCVIELDCRLIIYRPVTDENALSNYADTVGYATVQGGTVGQFSGFTVGTIDVSGINATAKEKQAISAAFANGVYL